MTPRDRLRSECSNPTAAGNVVLNVGDARKLLALAGWG